MVYLTRKEHFNAAHKLYNAQWTEEKNREIFGKCANKNFHGHNYDLFVTIKGEPDPETGMIMNAKALSTLIKREILSRFDHKNLNVDVPYFKDIQPSSENLAKVIWDILAQHLDKDQLYAVKLYETENIYVEYFGK